MLFFGTRFRVFEDKLPLTTNCSAHFNHTVDLRDLSGVFRTTCFEEFSNTRQTAGDVLSLRDLTRSLSQQRACLDLLSFIDDDVCASGNGVARENFLLVTDND